MKKSSIFRQLLFYLICACLLTAALSVVIYSFTGAEVYARRIAEEMVPRAHGMARLAERYQTGQISFDSFLDFVLRDQQGARVYIFDDDAQLIAYTSSDMKTEPSRSMQDMARDVLENGKTLISTKWRTADGIVVGVPIRDNMQRMIGTIMIAKPSYEVVSSVRTLILALLAGSLLVSALMIIPAYYVSKRMSSPIKNMTEASIAMAGGDFTVRADESRRDEIGLLGCALNHMSQRLRMNIHDLVLARNRLHVILEGLHEGVVALDSDNRLVYENQSALRLFDCADEETLSQKLGDVFPVMQQVIQTGQPQQLYKEEGDNKLLLVVSCSQEMTELPPGTVVVIQDITAAERLEQTRRDYVANVSHELRTPIASIRSLAETLNDGLIQSEEDRSRYYGYILRESMRLSRLINDLLELSRLQSGAVALEKQTFHLNPLLEEVAERMRITASYSDISVDLTLLTGNDAVLSNRDRIEQVLIALMDNAIKFASDDGTVHLAVADEGDHMAVSVRNTGHINERDLSHLFERFYKADASHHEGGTGLGLAIVQEILHLLGEQVQARNDGEDAVFSFTIHKGADDERRGAEA